MTELILRRLRYDKEYIDKICYLVMYHDVPICNKQIEEDMDLSLKLYEIQCCDGMAHNPDRLDVRIEYLDKTYEKIKSLGKNPKLF